MAKQFVSVSVGDVICLKGNDCQDASSGEYVVEEAMDRGGWFVTARKLNGDGSFSLNNTVIFFHQCPGYNNSLIEPEIVGHMTRIFV